jgi:DNA-directed RNA polymerase alpha subunit
LETKGITTLAQLTAYSEKEILQLHGMGKSSIPKLRAVLEEKGLSFKSE